MEEVRLVKSEHRLPVHDASSSSLNDQKNEMINQYLLPLQTFNSLELPVLFQERSLEREGGLSRAFSLGEGLHRLVAFVYIYSLSHPKYSISLHKPG